MKTIFLTAFLSLVIASTSFAQQKGETTFSHQCFKELEVTVKNYGYLKDNKAYGWGIKIKNNYKTPVTFNYSLIVGDEKPGEGQPTYVIEPGGIWASDWGRLTLLLKKSSSTEFKVHIWKLCFKGYDCSDNNYFDCDGKQVKDKLLGPNWKNNGANKNNANATNYNSTNGSKTNVNDNAGNSGNGIGATSDKPNNTSVYNNNIEVVDKIDVNPQFPGGREGWVKYLTMNLKADVPLKYDAPLGTYSVKVEFIVDKNGAVSNVHCINDPGYGTCAEAIRIIQQGPNWIPGKLNGRNVAVKYTQPISFRVSAD